MRTKNLAVLPRTAALNGHQERIRTLVVNHARRVLHRYHLRVCAMTGLRMSRREAVRGGASVMMLSLALITAECLPLCVLFLMLSALLSQPWRR